MIVCLCYRLPVVAHDLLFFEKEKKQKKDLTDRFFVGLG